MTARLICSATTLVVVCLLMFLSGCDDGSSTGVGGNGDSDSDSDTDTDVDTDTDADTESSTSSDSDTQVDTGTEVDTDIANTCPENGDWFDETTGLCWQDPPAESGYSFEDAPVYCADLVEGGFSNWRLPLIQELFSLIRGCSSSDCGVSDPDCLQNWCLGAECESCEDTEGPDDEPYGCYWDPALSGDCSSYWSASGCASAPVNGWRVRFSQAMIGESDKGSTLDVRCVRGELPR